MRWSAARGPGHRIGRLTGYLVRPLGLLITRTAVVTVDTGAAGLDITSQDPPREDRCDLGSAAAGESSLQIEPLPDRVGLKVTGELDLAGRQGWEQALEQAVSRGFDVHVDLSGLTFTDVAGVALLVGAAERLVGGGRMTVHQPPRGWLLIYDLFWPDGAPAIEVVWR